MVAPHVVEILPPWRNAAAWKGETRGLSGAIHGGPVAASQIPPPQGRATNVGSADTPSHGRAR